MSTDTSAPAVAKPKSEAESSPKRSAVEGMKENSRHLRGTIALDLVKEVDHFGEADKNLLKFHGTYQQEDRDARKNRSKEGVGKHYMFMVRCKIPGGRMTAKQYLAMDDLAGTYANGTLRFTTRQGIQFHGVLKSHLKETIAGINESLLSTLGACGDVERNVMACPAPHHHNGVRAQLQETAKILAAHLAPRTKAYHEIWLNGEAIHETPAEADIEPIYGKVYLPRKFKTGLTLPEDNCIDIYAQDLGLLAIVENGSLVGYNVLVGGGMGMTHGNANTFPHLARPICYVPAAAVVGAAEAVIKLFRDHGNRADRKRARIKYLVHDWGVERFGRLLAEYIGGELQPPRAEKVAGFEPHLGWHEQGDGKYYYGLSVENGRVKDEGTLRLRSGLRALVERYQPALRLTPLQDILLCDLDKNAKAEIEKALGHFGVLRPDQISSVQKYSMACPAVPTCGLALSESERVLPDIIDELEAVLEKLGLADEKLSVRMTGCPNGCARPYQSDIGLVGRSGDKYTVFVGGNVLGDRLNFVLRDLVPFAEIVPLLTILLEHFKGERQEQESFGDYCHRLGAEKLQGYLPEEKTKGSHTKSHSARTDSATAVNGEPAETNGNSTSSVSSPLHSPPEKTPAIDRPETLTMAVEIAKPEVTAAVGVAGIAMAKQSSQACETFFSGPRGEELADCTYRYYEDGSVRETVVYFYGDDRRATQARIGEPLRRQAIYEGRANPIRLHAARKLADIRFVGPAGSERRDVRIEYHPDGSVEQTAIFYYEGDARAANAPDSAALRRQIVYAGLVP